MRIIPFLFGSSMESERKIKQAKWAAYFTCGMNIAVYFLAGVWPQLLPYGGVLEGGIFLVLGYCIGEFQVWAGWTATIILALDVALKIPSFSYDVAAII